MLLGRLLAYASLCLGGPLLEGDALEKGGPTPLFSLLTSIDLRAPSSGIEGIDCIYVINLDERVERWQRTEAILSAYGLSPNRMSAINGWSVPVKVQAALASPYPRRLRGGQLGCLLSHLSVLQDARKRGFGIIWVLEDDIEVLEDPHQLSTIVDALSSIDPAWDILYTDIDMRADEGGYLVSHSADFRPGRREHPAEYYAQRLEVSDDLMQIRGRFGTHSMIISQRGICRILDYFAVRALWTSIDIELHYIPGIREYATRRDIVSNMRHSPSDTEQAVGVSR